MPARDGENLTEKAEAEKALRGKEADPWIVKSAASGPSMATVTPDKAIGPRLMSEKSVIELEPS
jgi:hypothetical protein